MHEPALDCIAILAGGLATRMGALTTALPKSLIPINGDPFIAHQLRQLRRNGIKRVVLCVGHLGEAIRDYVGSGDHFDMSVSYSFDGPQLLGTAGAIRKALVQLPEHFFLMYGDTFLDCDYQKAWQAYLVEQKLGLMTIFRNRDRWDVSNVQFDGDRILAYDKSRKTSPMEYIDCGLEVFDRRAFEAVPEKAYFDLADLCRLLLEQDQLAPFEIHSRFFEIGSLAGLSDTRQYLAH